MAEEKQSNYGAEQIQVLEGLEAVRKRPGMYIGTTSSDGLHHLVYEIVDNSIDEALAGYGKEINVTIHKDNSITVLDYGRGIPLDYNSKEDTYNWQLVFCELYAGGKYNNQGGENYEYSLGLNGLGACATQYASEYMSVRIEIPVIKTDITIFLRCFISFLPIKYIKAYILIYIYIQEMSRL